MKEPCKRPRCRGIWESDPSHRLFDTRIHAGREGGHRVRDLSQFRAPAFVAEVVGFRDKEVMLMPLGEMHGLGLGSKIVAQHRFATVPVGEGQLGRVLNGMGKPIDGKGDIFSVRSVRFTWKARTRCAGRPSAKSFTRREGDRRLITLGKGQRVGIMAGSGVGKSVLLGMMARSSQADVNVIAMVGERGREVREFVENTLGEEGLRQSVVVAATSDQSPLLRMRAAYVATTIAEYFCSLKKDVLLVMDSVTRFAMAQREIGLNMGEPPATKGYTPSVFSTLPKLLERAGNFDDTGSITGLYTVLVEGDDMNDPIGDSVRAIVDGHIVLTRSLAKQGISRDRRFAKYFTGDAHVVSPEHFRQALHRAGNDGDLPRGRGFDNIGAYKSGSNARIDMAIRMEPLIEQFLRQNVDEATPLDQAVSMMASMG